MRRFALVPVRLFTIGYEGSDLRDFLASIAAVGVCQVIDIRDVPLSRKRGFSKNALAEALESAGISYVHLKKLGDPKDGRMAARRGDYEGFRRIYEEHLAGLDAQSALATAALLADEHVSCLLCFERDPRHCHRTIVAAAMARSGRFVVTHLGVKEGAGLTLDDQRSLRELAVG